MKKNLILLLLCCWFAGCERKAEVVVPNICPTENFTVPLLNHASTVDLSNATLLIKADFTERVKWSVVIKGLTTGAQRTFSANSNAVNINWLGESENHTFFGQEMCDVLMQVNCTETITSKVQITGKPTFTNIEWMYLIKNFDGAGISGAMERNGVASMVARPEFPNRYNNILDAPSDPSPQGGSYYYISGDTSAITYYFGGIDMGGFALPLAWKDEPASNLYVNLYVKGEGYPSSEFLIQFLEGPTARIFRKNITWTGWKMFSIKLSDLDVRDPTKLGTVSLGVGSAPGRTARGVGKFDFIILTKGRPFLAQ